MLSHPEGSFVDQLLSRARRDRLAELFCTPDFPAAVYRQYDRQGVTTIALRQRDLTPKQLEAILRYRLANALLCGDVSPEPVAERRAEAEWWFEGTPSDVHILAGSARSGAILAYLALAFAPGASETMTLATETRPRFEVEDVFGWRVYHGVPELAGVPLTKLSEMRRFSRANWQPPFGELAFRAPIEVCSALARLMLGPMASEIAALLGDVEADKAQRNIDYFDMVSTRLTEARPRGKPLPYPEATREVEAYPIVLLTADFPAIRDRLTEIEEALRTPWPEGRRLLLKTSKRGTQHGDFHRVG